MRRADGDHAGGALRSGRFPPEFESPQAWEAFGRTFFDGDPEVAGRVADRLIAYFAQQIGLVDAWETYGWPAGCQRIPEVQVNAPRFVAIDSLKPECGVQNRGTASWR